MNVISLFDGISCGRLALDRAGISVRQYIASEIHPPSLTISHHRHPSIIQVGDVRTYIPTHQPDLLIGGSPCTNFSTAGNGMGLEGVHSLTDYLTKKKIGCTIFGTVLSVLGVCTHLEGNLSQVVATRKCSDEGGI